MTNIKDVLGGAFTASLDKEGDFEGGVSTPKLIDIEAPDVVFCNGIDMEALEASKNMADKFNELSGRFDPFDLDKLEDSVGNWSTLIGRHIITFEDTLFHAAALCALWKAEDGELEQIARMKADNLLKKEAKAAVAVFKEGTKEYEIEQARLAWREGIRKRDSIIAEWTEYVSKLRKRYQELRDS